VKDVVHRNILAVLEGASAHPHGEHGSPARPLNGLFRVLTWMLAPATRVLFSVVRGSGRVSAALLKPLGLEPRPPRLHWAIVPHAPVDPPPERRTQIDLTVVTSLAPGSDQIVAGAIHECAARPEERNRIVEAVLPLPANLYKQHFDEDQDGEAFDDLMKRDRGANNTHPTPTVVYPDFPRDSEGNPVELRQAYGDAGRKVVESSEILLAIWDPTRDARPGGTLDAIEYAMSRGQVVLWLDPTDLARGARWLKALPGDETDLESTDPPKAAKELSKNFHRLAAYNRDAAWDAEVFDQIERAERRHIAEVHGVPESVIEVVCAGLLPHFARADQLAGRYHALRNFVTVFLLTLSALAVTLMAFQILFWPELYWLATVEILLLLVGYLSYRLSLREAWHEKWIYDRHLAERLRCLLYTFAVPAGFPEPAREGGDRKVQLLPFYRPANAWFMDTLARSAGRLQRVLSTKWKPEDHVPAIRDLVRVGWIEQQADYHEAVRRQAAMRERRERAVTAAALVGIFIVAVAHALGIGHGSESESVHRLARIDLWIAFFTIAIPTWAAAYQAVALLDDPQRTAERAERMAAQLRGLATKLSKAETLDDIDEVVKEARRLTELESHEHVASLLSRQARPQ